MKKLITLVLAIAMMASTLCVSANAAHVAADVDACPYASTSTVTPYNPFTMAYCGNYVNANGEEAYYEVWELGSAHKISNLLEAIYPVNHLIDDLALLKKWNNPDYARYTEVYFAHDSLDSFLSESTRSALSVICPQTTQQLIQVMRNMPEYADGRYAHPLVHEIVDTYLEQNLSGDNVRWGLNVLTGANRFKWQKSPYNEMELEELIASAESFVDTDEFRTLDAILGKLYCGNTDEYALSHRYSADKLDAIWDELKAAAEVYWPQYTYLLDHMRFTVYPVPEESAPADTPYVEYGTIEEPLP